MGRAAHHPWLGLLLTCCSLASSKLQEAKRQLDEVRAELAAERSAHDTTKQALKRESEQREAALAAAVAVPAAAAAAAAAPGAVASHPISSPGASPHKLSPREAAVVRQQVLDLEVSLLPCLACVVEKYLC